MTNSDRLDRAVAEIARNRQQKLTGRGHLALRFAQQQAQARAGEHPESAAVGAGHLLLSALQDETSVAGTALRNLGVRHQDLRDAVDHALQHTPTDTAHAEAQSDAESSAIIAAAFDLSQELGHAHVGTEHILLGLLRESTTAAAKILHSSGVTLDTARAEVTRALADWQHRPQGPTATCATPAA